MDLSRIGRGGLGVCKEPVELKTIVDQAVEATHAHFKHRRHRLSVRIPEEPVHIDGDPARLVQLLSNLLDNAAKYTLKDGEISIAADCTDKDVFIRVRDNGIGISERSNRKYFRSLYPAQRVGEERTGPRSRFDDRDEIW